MLIITKYNDAKTPPSFFPPVYIRTMISAFEWLPLKKKDSAECAGGDRR